MTYHDEEKERKPKKKKVEMDEDEEARAEKELAKAAAYPFACDDCDKRFANFSGMKVHMKSSHKYREADFCNHCDICGRKFSTQRSLQAHMENTHYVRCETCGETFQHEYQLENHIRRRHKTQIKCDTCGKIFRSEGALEIHKESHKKPEFKCDRKFCTAEFFTETELLTHTFEHEEKEKREQMEKEQLERESTYECKKCDRKFRTEKSYKMHMQEHSDADDNRKECPKCFRMFMTEDSLTVHIESAHPDFDYNQYLLKVSKDKERGFDKKNRFEDEKLFKEDGWRCKICKKSFNSKEVYEYHMRKHDGNLKCPKCKEEFRNQSGLDLHLKLCREGDDKINIEKHECDKCGKKFGSESQLKFHMVSAHDKEVHGYECKQCGKVLSSEASLELHMETHEFLEELEKMYQCTICKKTFDSERAAKFHEETAHIEEVIIKCTLCDRQFDSDKTMNIHMKHSHPLEYKLYQSGKHEDAAVKEEPVKKRHKCPECDSTFISQNTLQMHIKNVHCVEDMEAFSHRVEMIAKSRIEETLEDLDDFEVPKLRDNKTEEKSSFRTRKTDYSAMETDDEKSTSLNWKSPSKTESWKSSEPPKNEKVSMFAPSSRDDDFSDDDLDEYQCPSCPKKFLSKRLLDRHKSLCVEHNKTSNSSSEQKPDSSPKFEYKPEVHKCDECGKEFRSANTLRIHKEGHEEDRREEEEAKKRREDEKKRKESSVDKRNEFNSFLRDASEVAKMAKFQTSVADDDSDDDYTPSEYKFKCEACGKSFMTEMMLKYHGCEAKKEEEEDNGFDCPECGKKYWSQKMLDIHKKTHLKFDDDDDLTNDILNMKIEMPKLKTKVEIEGPPDDDLLICDDCDQTFTSAVLFRIHKRAHENEHKYVLGVQQEMEECDRAEEKRRAIEDDDDDAPSGSGLSKL